MKIKGLKSMVQQVTFEGDKHPSCGVVSTFTWRKLAEHLGVKNNDKVISFRIDKDGLTVFWSGGVLLGHTPTL